MWGEKLCSYAQYLNQTYGLASLVKSKLGSVKETVKTDMKSNWSDVLT